MLPVPLVLRVALAISATLDQVDQVGTKDQLVKQVAPVLMERLAVPDCYALVRQGFLGALG